MKKFRKLSKRLTLPIMLLLTISSCQNIDEYKKERVAKADRAFKEIKANDIPKEAILSLPYCINTALTNNLNLRVYELKEAVNREQKTAAALGMLPDVIITNDISYRTNQPGASSYSLESGQMSLEPSQSSQDYENRVRVEFLFSFIDFGLAYFNAVQARDRTLITTEQKRRATQNLILDVSRAYFKVAAAQYAMENTERMLMIADNTEKLLEEMVRNKKLPLEKIIIEKKTFLVLKKSLMEYKRSYENSCIELRSLMGYYPSHEVVVDTTGMKKLANLRIPNVELLEEIALLERPELYQLDLQHHITAISARKKVIEMFPNVGIFTDFSNSTNKYLYNQSWWELGARAAYRLLRVPQQIGEYVAIESEMDQIDVQVNALSIGIISQVRIAHANLMEVKHRYSIAEELYDTYLKHEIIKEEQAKTAGALSTIELNRIKMETAQKDIERTQALGNYYLAYFRLLNSVGLENMDSEIIKKIKERIKASFTGTEEEETENIAEYKYEINELQKEIDKYNTALKDLGVVVTDKTQKVSDADNGLGLLKDDLSNRQNNDKQESAAVIEQYKKKIEENVSKLNETEKKLKETKINYYSNLRNNASLHKEKKNTLYKQIADHKVEINKLEDQLDLTKDNYEEKIENIKDKYEDLIENAEDIISEVNSYTAKLNKENKNNKDELADLNKGKTTDAVKKNVEDIKFKIEDFNAKSNKLKGEQKTLKSELSKSLASAEENYNKKKNSFIADIKNLKKNMEDKKNDLNASGNEYDSLYKKIKQDYSNEREQLKSRRSTSIDIVEQSQDKLEELLDDYEDVVDKIKSDSYSKIDGLDDSIADNLGSIEDFKDDIADNMNDLSDLKDEDKISAINIKVGKLESEMQKFESKVKSDKDEISSIRTDMKNELAKTENDYHTEREGFHSGIEKANNDITDSENKLVAIEKNYYAALDKAEIDYNNNKQILKKELASLDNKIESNDDKLDFLEGNIDDINERIKEDCETKVSVAERKIDNINEYIEDLNDELEDSSEHADNSVERDKAVSGIKNRINILNNMISDSNAKENKLAKELSSIKNERASKLADVEKGYVENNKRYKAELAESKSGLSGKKLEFKKIEKDYDKQLDNSEEIYEESSDSLQTQIAVLYKDKETYSDSIDDEKDRIEDVLSDRKYIFKDKIEHLNDEMNSTSRELDGHKKIVAEYAIEVNKLETQKKVIEEKLKESSDIISEHGTKLARYIVAINLLEENNKHKATALPSREIIDKAVKGVPENVKTLNENVNNVEPLNSPNQSGVKDAIPSSIKPEDNLNKEEALAPPNQSGVKAASPTAITHNDNLNMEAQTQATSDGGIGFLEYTPEATKNIDLQTQNNAGNNDISIMGFNPDTQNDIEMQTLNDAGNSEINFQEYGSNLNTGDDSIGNADSNNKVDNQLKQSLTEKK